MRPCHISVLQKDANMTTITQTAQPAIAPLAAAPYAPAVTGAENATNAAIGDLDFSQFYEQLLAGLDSDGDRQISDQEWANYRASKAARGEYIPADGPTQHSHQSMDTRAITETLFRAAMKERD